MLKGIPKCFFGQVLFWRPGGPRQDSASPKPPTPKPPTFMAPKLGPRPWNRLSYLTIFVFRIVVETRRDRPRIARNRCVPVRGYRAGYFGLGLASFRSNPGSKSKISGRILNSFRGPFSSAEWGLELLGIEDLLKPPFKPYLTLLKSH